MSRRAALVRLAAAYGRHVVRRRFRPTPPASAEDLLGTYAADRLQPLTPDERARLPAMSRCINCGLCAMAVRRVGGARLPDLGIAYLRDHTLLPAVARDLEGADLDPAALAAAAAACPVGVPLGELVAAAKRLSGA